MDKGIIRPASAVTKTKWKPIARIIPKTISDGQEAIIEGRGEI